MGAISEKKPNPRRKSQPRVHGAHNPSAVQGAGRGAGEGFLFVGSMFVLGRVAACTKCDCDEHL